MSAIRGGYPCKLCRKVLYATEEGQGFKAGPLVFATCNDCAPKIRLAAKAAGAVAKAGVSALVIGKFPGLAPVLSELALAWGARGTER